MSSPKPEAAATATHVDVHRDRANTALGLSIGTAAGAVLGASVLPGVGFVLGPIVGGALGSIAGLFAKRLSTK